MQRHYVQFVHYIREVHCTDCTAILATPNLGTKCVELKEEKTAKRRKINKKMSL